MAALVSLIRRVACERTGRAKIACALSSPCRTFLLGHFASIFEMNSPRFIFTQLEALMTIVRYAFSSFFSRRPLSF